MKKKLLVSLIAVVLVLVLSVGIFAACNKKKNNGGEVAVPAFPEKTEQQAYDNALGDFATALELAKTKLDVNERYAYMALAEAKMLEATAYLPTTSRGGSYAITRLAPYSVSPVLFGTDNERLHGTIVADKLIVPEDRDALKAIYAEEKAKGEAGDYAGKAKAYLGSHGYVVKNEYRYSYTTAPVTLDITNTQKQPDARVIAQTYDGLMEYNEYGILSPALATSYDMSEDGLTYTFHIREGVKWVDQQGREHGTVTANDWVFGMKKILENKKTSGLVYGIIKNAEEYATAEITDFSQVGVKATDANTLVYTLEAPCSYFVTMLSYNPFAPIYQSYYETEGEDYGKDASHILYCGPYLITSYNKDTKIVFTKNANYWNPDAVQVDTLTWISYINQDTNNLYKDCRDNKLDNAGLTSKNLPLAKSDKLEGDTQTIFEKYAYTTLTDSTAFGVWFNLYRRTYSTDGYDDLNSPQTENQKNLAKWALSNVNFRRAVARAFDRASWNAVPRGADLCEANLQNMFTPGTFVALTGPVTLSINGTNRTFAAGTYYGEIVQAQISADLGADAPTVWNPQADGGIGSSGGFDGWYNPTVAMKYLNQAIEELKAQGVTVSKENPVHLDLPNWVGDELYETMGKTLKQNIERDLQGYVIINIVGTASEEGYTDAGFGPDEGEKMNYDIYDNSGWGPDYGDPATYLDCLKPVSGDMIKLLGLWK